MTPEQLLLRSALQCSPIKEGGRQSNLPQRDDFLRWATGAASPKDKEEARRSAGSDKVDLTGWLPSR